MANARIYIRRSDEEQSAWSPQAQERQCRQWCEQYAHEVVGVYTDDDLSGKRENRPDFERLLNDALADPGSLVIVHKIDRLARDTEIILNRHKKLKKHRVKLISVIEPIDFDTPFGTTALTWIASLGQFHVDNLAPEVSKGLRERFERGKWIGLLPYGYTSISDHDAKGERVRGSDRAVFSDDIHTVHVIFESYASGNYSDLTLAEEMNARGLTAVCKGTRVPFQKDTIAGILRNRFYLGYVTYKGEEKVGAHEPAIDQALWDQCQAIRQRRAASLDGTPRCGRVPIRGIGGILSELAFCARCGWKLHTMMNGEGNSRHRCYRCGQRRRFGVTACDAPMIVAETIESQVFDILRALTLPPTLRDAVIGEVQRRLEQPPTPTGISAAAVRAQMERLKDLYQLGDMEKAEYLQKRERLQRQLTQATAASPLALDLDYALTLLGDMPTLIDTATDAQRRGLLLQVFPTIWAEKEGVVAVRPSANFALLVQMIADMAAGGSGPVEVAPFTLAAASTSAI